jgi:hypothetical protein
LSAQTTVNRRRGHRQADLQHADRGRQGTTIFDQAWQGRFAGIDNEL